LSPNICAFRQKKARKVPLKVERKLLEMRYSSLRHAGAHFSVCDAPHHAATFSRASAFF
jgi:hypothetical protein